MEQFKNNELSFHLMVEASPNALILVNNLGNIAYLNSFAEKLFQYTKNELIGKNLEILIPSKFKNSHPNLIQSYLSNPISRQMGENRELFAVKKNGTEFPVEIGLNPIVTVDGTMVLAAIIDITERRKTEMQFRLVVQSVPNAIILVNSQGEITMTNKQTEKQFGYTNDELIGNKLEKLIPERYKINHPNFRNMFFANLQARPMGIGRDFFALRKDGTEFPAEIGLNPISTPEGTLVLASIIDITERKKLEENIKINSQKIEEQNIELKQSEQQLKELNATKDKLFSIIGHDLKSPFNTLLGFSDLLVKNAHKYTPEKVQQFAQNMNNSSRQAFKLLENLLEWARLQTGSIKANPVKIKPSDLINEVTLLTEQMSKSKNIDLQSIINCDNFVLADKEMIKTVLRNLVSNALKYTESGGIVKIETEIKEKNILFVISDTGLGIEPEHLDKLFRIDSKLSKTGTANETGTGLGLILCKEFVEKNNGTIWVESELGKGSEFKFTMPLCND